MIPFNRFRALRSRGLAVGAGVLSATALIVGVTATPASAAPPGTVIWQNYNVSSRCLWGENLDNGPLGSVFIFTCSFSDSGDEWQAAWASYGLTFQNEQTSQCLDSNYSNPSYPSVGAVYSDACNGNNTYQNWSVGGEGPALTIQDYQTGFCLNTNGATVWTDSCNWNNWYQNWQNEPPP